MTEASIIQELATWVDDRKFPFQLCNSFIYGWECDYWTMTADGETREFEIKISYQDFKNDIKKDKHRGSNGANYFYYVCPTSLIHANEVPQKYGLIWISKNGMIDIIKKPRRLNDNKFDRWQALATKMYWKFRTLWRDKFIKKEITYSQYREGFNLSLLDNEG